MTQNHRNRTVARFALLSVGLIMSVGACAQRDNYGPGEQFKPETTQFRNEVVPMTAQTQVRFLPGDFGVIAPDEGARLDGFLSANRVGPGARVSLSTPGNMVAAEAVRDRLVARGLRPSDIAVRRGGAASRSNLQVVDISIEQYQVRPPQCGNWTDVRNFESTTSDFGCSTVRALGLMVADPHDLVAGQDAGHTSGTTQTGAVERYWADKQTPFLTNELGATK